MTPKSRTKQARSRHNTDFNWSNKDTFSVRCSQNRFGKPSFLNVALSCSKTGATAWILFNIRPLTLTSPPTSISNQVGRKWFDLGGKQSIWKSNRLGHEVLLRLFDLVCSCWFWQWEILTAGVYFFSLLALLMPYGNRLICLLSCDFCLRPQNQQVNMDDPEEQCDRLLSCRFVKCHSPSSARIQSPLLAK